MSRNRAWGVDGSHSEAQSRSLDQVSDTEPLGEGRVIPVDGNHLRVADVPMDPIGAGHDPSPFNLGVPDELYIFRTRYDENLPEWQLHVQGMNARCHPEEWYCRS